LRRNLSRDFSLTLTVSGRTTRSLRSTPPGKFSHKFLWKVFHSLATVIKTRRRTPPLWKRGVCDQTSVVYPCVPDNRLRIVKLGRVDAIKKLEHRASPPAILQKLGLVDQVSRSRGGPCASAFCSQMWVGAPHLPRVSHFTGSVLGGCLCSCSALRAPAALFLDGMSMADPSFVVPQLACVVPVMWQSPLALEC